MFAILGENGNLARWYLNECDEVVLTFDSVGSCNIWVTDYPEDAETILRSSKYCCGSSQYPIIESDSEVKPKAVVQFQFVFFPVVSL